MPRTWIAAVAALLLSACGAEPTLEDLRASEPELFESTPRYATDIAPLIEKYCVACHDGGGMFQGGVELETYEKLFNARGKSVCVTVTTSVWDAFAESLTPQNPVFQDLIPCQSRLPSGNPLDGYWEAYTMPPGAKSRLTLREQVLLARWLEIGAPR